MPCNMLLVDVSILAPAQGASISLKSEYIPNYVSILAPAQGASTAPVNLIRDYAVSILAPAQGASAKISNFFFYIYAEYLKYYLIT